MSSRTLITGRLGSGKTSYAVAQVIPKLSGKNKVDYLECIDKILSYNKKHNTKLSIPSQDHVVYSNFTIKYEFPEAESYYIDGDDFRMPKDGKGKRLTWCATYVFDEAQKIWPSSRSGSFNDRPKDLVSIQLGRKRRHTLYFICPYYIDIAKGVRDLCDNFVYIIRNEHLYKFNGKKFKERRLLKGGKILRTTWWGVKFESEASLESYLKASTTEEKKKYGTPFDETLIGDIRDYYNTEDLVDEYDNTDSDFEYMTLKEYVNGKQKN